jgi:mannose-6-phosphate isomerase-like protein (cupin superfamily)
MEKELLHSHPFPHSDNGSYNPSYLSINLPALIENMKHEKTWRKGKLTSMILMKTPGKKVVLTLVPEGTEISSFQKNDSATFQIAEGRLTFYFEDEYVNLNKNEILTINKKIDYSFYSIVDTAFLLTLISGN